MSGNRKLWFWWSSGKDSAWALHELMQQGSYQIDALVTTLNKEADRVAMHAVRRSLLEKQAAVLNIPLKIIELPHPCTEQDYADAAAAAVNEAVQEHISHMAFGDLYLEHIRDHRLELIKDTPIEAVFPLWQRDTKALAEKMINAGLEAYITCVDPNQLDKSFVGRAYDHSFLNDLPAAVDPCGENGEFHTFVKNVPSFSNSIDVVVGETVERGGFYFADILLADGVTH